MKLSELGLEVLSEFAKHWQAFLVALAIAMLALLLIGVHASWSFSLLPLDHYRSTEQMARRLAPGYRWEGSSYGLFSALRCPNWEAASFRLVGRAQSDEATPDVIMCCTAELKPRCALRPTD